MEKHFPVEMSSPDIQPQDIEAVCAVLRGGTLSMGPWLEKFEQAFADYIGVRHAVAVSSGTAGLHLCMRALEIGDGDEVITTPFGFVASANCILYEGGKPVFADIDPDTLNISAAEVAARVNGRTRAILPVHVFGEPADMHALDAIAAARDIPLIEDACEAIGAQYRGRKVGGFGRAAIFSFYPNKQMTTGEGAMVTTNDRELAGLLKSLRNQGREEMGARLDHVRLGYNYRMTEMSAALGLSQLARIESLLEKRRDVANLYLGALSGCPGIRLPAPASPKSASWFVFVVRLDEAINRDRIIACLEARGIPSRAYFSPIHLQPYFRKKYGYRPGDFPVAERIAGSTLALPFHANLPAEAITIVAEALRDAIAAG